jgi:hypothetical protein
MSHLRTHLNDQSGQALVEFALVLPLLILLLFGMLDFGKAFNYSNDATHLAAEGARFAVVDRKPTPASALSLQAQLLSQADAAELRNGGTAALAAPAQVCIDFPNGGTPVFGDPVRVRMIFTYAFIPFIGNRVGANKTITASSVMRLERVPTTYSAGCT